MFNVLDTLAKLATESGFAGFFAAGGWQNLVMIVIACVLLYLGIVKGFEPLLLVGIERLEAGTLPLAAIASSITATATSCPMQACLISSTSASRPACIRR